MFSQKNTKVTIIVLQSKFFCFHELLLTSNILIKTMKHNFTKLHYSYDKNIKYIILVCYVIYVFLCAAFGIIYDDDDDDDD